MVKRIMIYFTALLLFSCTDSLSEKEINKDLNDPNTLHDGPIGIGIGVGIGKGGGGSSSGGSSGGSSSGGSTTYSSKFTVTSNGWISQVLVKTPTGGTIMGWNGVNSKSFSITRTNTNNTITYTLYAKLWTGETKTTTFKFGQNASIYVPH